MFLCPQYIQIFFSSFNQFSVSEIFKNHFVALQDFPMLVCHLFETLARRDGCFFPPKVFPKTKFIDISSLLSICPSSAHESIFLLEEKILRVRAHNFVWREATGPEQLLLINVISPLVLVCLLLVSSTWLSESSEQNFSTLPFGEHAIEEIRKNSGPLGAGPKETFPSSFSSIEIHTATKSRF